MAMSKEDTQVKVIAIIAEKLSVDPATITPERSFKDLGADSLDTVEIIMSFEEAFGIEIRDEDAERIKSVQEAIDLIHNSRTK